MGAKENTGARNTREALILAGLEELNEYGIQHFSTRRVAKACGMSCAAPYKHFKDSHEFIAEILGYINRLYDAEQTVLLGDRLYTDVACGVNAGVDTVFLLSGEGVLADIDRYDIHPTWIYENIEKFYEDLKENGR